MESFPFSAGTLSKVTDTGENAFVARPIGIGQYISATWETEAEGFKANLVNLEDCLKIENKTEVRMLPYIQHLLSIHKFLCTSPSTAV